MDRPQHTETIKSIIICWGKHKFLIYPCYGSSVFLKAGNTSGKAPATPWPWSRREQTWIIDNRYLHGACCVLYILDTGSQTHWSSRVKEELLRPMHTALIRYSKLLMEWALAVCWPPSTKVAWPPLPHGPDTGNISLGSSSTTLAASPGARAHNEGNMATGN